MEGKKENEACVDARALAMYFTHRPAVCAALVFLLLFAYREAIYDTLKYGLLLRIDHSKGRSCVCGLKSVFSVALKQSQRIDGQERKNKHPDENFFDSHGSDLMYTLYCVYPTTFKINQYGM
jgi:hypothetical protein